MVYNCLHGKAPSYLTDCCTLISDVASRRHLRSASRRQLLVPRHNLSTYGRRAFSVAGYLKLVCLLSTSAYSALEVLHIMRYINLLTYLLCLQMDSFKLKMCQCGRPGLCSRPHSTVGAYDSFKSPSWLERRHPFPFPRHFRCPERLAPEAPWTDFSLSCWKVVIVDCQ